MSIDCLMFKHNFYFIFYINLNDLKYSNIQIKHFTLTNQGVV